MIRRFNLRILPAVIVAMTVATIGLTSFAGGAGKRDALARRAKADYLFTEAYSQLSAPDVNVTDAILMLRRASELSPEDNEIAAGLGELYLAANMVDSVTFYKAYESVKNRFFDNPKEYFNGVQVLKMSEFIDDNATSLRVYEVLEKTFPSRSDYALNHAWQYAHAASEGELEGGLDSAIAIYDRLEKGMGTVPELMRFRIAAHMVNNDTAGALANTRRLVAAAPRDIDAALVAAQVFDYYACPDSVVYYYDAACAIDPSNGEALYTRANYFLAQGDTTRYSGEIEDILRNHSIEFEDKMQVLKSYSTGLFTDTLNHSEISRMFRIVEDLHPGESDLHALYGSYLSAIDSVAESAVQFGYTIALSPEDPDGYQARLQALYQIHDTDAALSTAKDAAARFKDAQGFYFSYMATVIYMEQEKYQDAVNMLDSVDTSVINDPGILSIYHQIRGDVLYKMNYADSAFVEYDKSLEYDPTNIGVQNNAAYYMAVQGVNLDRAEQLITSALLEEPRNPTYIDTYAWVLFRKKDYQGARKQIDEVLDIYGVLPGSEDSVIVAQDTLVVTEVEAVVDTVIADYDNVLEVVETAEPESPSSEVYDHAGDIYFMNGEPEQAVIFWERALALDPENKKIIKKVKNKAYFFE